MKKLLRNLLLLLLPILLYFLLFLRLEGNNYFGLRAETPSGAIVGALREYGKEPTNAILLGDSRFAHMDTVLINETSGRHFANLAFGGASLKEQLDLLEWLLEEHPNIREVVFGLSYYTLNVNYGLTDRITGIQDMLRNPFLYMGNLGYNIEAVQRIPDWLAGRELFGADETENPADYRYELYTAPISGRTGEVRTRVAAHMRSMEQYASNWDLNLEELERLMAMAEYCLDAGIRFVIVLPPANPDVLAFQVYEYGIDTAMLPVLEALRETGAEVYDYEITRVPYGPDEQDRFFDGLHLDTVRGLPAWTRMLFEELR